MTLLANRRYGATSEWMRARVGKSVVDHARSAERRVGRLERTLVHRLRVPRGLILYGQDGKPIPIDFSPDGRIQVMSSDDSVGLARSFGRKYALDLTAAGGGCDCCPEDITWEVTAAGDNPDCFEVVFVPETCTWRLIVDYDCLCLYCSGGGGG